MASKVGKSTGKSEWISPHKLSLLVLIKALCSKEKDGNDYSQCITRCRHYLSLFMLEILQVLEKLKQSIINHFVADIVLDDDDYCCYQN